MQTNYARDIYYAVESIKLQQAKKKTAKGLLSPKSSFSPIVSDVTKQPIYKIAKYKNAIKSHRMEFLNNGNTTT